MNEIKNKFPRRSFLKLAGLLAATLACADSEQVVKLLTPTPDSYLNGPENFTSNFGYNYFFYKAMSGIKFPVDPNNPNKEAEAIAQFKKLINNPVQADNFLTTIISNQNSFLDGNFITEQAIAEGRGLGATLCVDARGSIMSRFKAIINGVTEEFFVNESRLIGAQPTLFRQGINKSLFFSHGVVPTCEGGITCGFLAGVEQVITKGEVEARTILAQHKVPEETINYIIEWKNKYGNNFAKEGLSAEKWSEVGGDIQAYINAQKKGQHITLWGVQINGTGQFEAKGYVEYIKNADGSFTRNVYTIAEGNAKNVAPELAGAAEFLNQPHPMIESMLKQTPKINVISTSRSGVQTAFGDLVIAPGEAFVVSQPGGEITQKMLDDMILSGGYSVSALQQNGNIIYLSADNATEMSKLRQTILKSSYIDDFIKKGGVIFEVTTDEATGLFKPEVVIRKYENPLVLVTLSPEEEILINNGARRVIGALKVADRGGNTMSVLVRSAVNNQDYIIEVPKGVIITAEVLESAGLPAAEAYWWESAVIKSGRILGQIGAGVGILLMVADGLKYINNEILGLGEEIQISASSDFNPSTEDIRLPVINDEIATTLALAGLERSFAMTVFESSLGSAEFTLKNRIDAYSKQLAMGIEDPTPVPFRLRIDGKPLLELDQSDDTVLPIVVTPTYHPDPNHPAPIEGYRPVIIDSITYTNTDTGQTIVFERQPDGTFPDSLSELNFELPLQMPGSESILLIPMKLHFEGKQLIIEPNYPGAQSSAEPKKNGEEVRTSITPPPEYSAADIVDINKYREEYGRMFGTLFYGMEKVLSALS